MEKNKDKELTVNELVKVKNIKDIYIYRKDNLLITLIKVHSINIALMPREEKKARTNKLASNFRGDKKDFAYVSYPREVDLDFYTDDVKRRYAEELNINRKKLLKEILLEGIELSSIGENYEHQHFIKIWKMITNDVKEAESLLRNRVEEFVSWYEGIGVSTEILQEQEVLKVCNLFGNSVQAPYINIGDNTIYEPIMQIKEE